MPKAKSAEKQARASERRRLHNRSIKGKIRTGMRHFLQLLKIDPAKAREQGQKVVSMLDRAAKTRVLHVNTARRHKTKMMARMQSLAK